MAVISFNKKPATTTTTIPAAPETLPAPAPAPASTAVATLAQSPQIQGEFTSRDMAVPFLNLGQKSGTMCDEKPEWIGKWVFDKAFCVGTEVKVVFCRLKKTYEQVLEFGSPEIPQTFSTAQEYKEAGFTDTQVRDVCQIDLLLECPSEELAEHCMIEAEGKAYAPARYVVRSSAYGKTVGIILKDLAGWLKNDLPSGFYTMSTEKKTGNNNTWFVPKLATAGKVPASLRGQIAEKFGI